MSLEEILIEIRKTPLQLWVRFAEACREDGKNVRQGVVEALNMYLDNRD